MSSPADSFHGSTRAVFFGSGYNEKDSRIITESVNEDSLLVCMSRYYKLTLYVCYPTSVEFEAMYVTLQA